MDTAKHSKLININPCPVIKFIYFRIFFEKKTSSREERVNTWIVHIKYTGTTEGGSSSVVGLQPNHFFRWDLFLGLHMA